MCAHQFHHTLPPWRSLILQKKREFIFVAYQLEHMSNHIEGDILWRVHITISSSWHPPTIPVEITFFFLRSASTKVEACGGIAARTCTKSVADQFKVIAPGFLFFTPKGQEPSFHFIPLRRFYWLALHYYMSWKMSKNSFFGTSDPVFPFETIDMI